MSEVLHVVARGTAKEGQFEALCMAAKRWVSASRAEPGCLRFDLNRDTEELNRLVLIASWESNDAHEAHGRTSHVQEFVEASTKLLASPIEIMRLKPIA